MRIGILTFHRAINYGAVLQCYGLCETLKAMGHEVNVIDYRPECIEYYRRMIPFYKISHVEGLCDKVKIIIVSLLKMGSVKDANRRFDSFLDKYFLFSKVVTSKDDFPKDYDIVFFGSDQIWSPQICNGFDSIYWGQFQHDNTRLMTYAASLGGHNLLSVEDWNTIGEYLKDFEKISVRESQLKDDLEGRLGIRSELVADPTILVNEDCLVKITKRPERMPNNYVLVFAVAPTDNLYGFAEKVALQLKSEIVVLTANKLRKCKYRNVTPTVEDFLGWFKYAKCVVTVSFHGTVFSVLFKKDFYSLTNYMQDRAELFLKDVGLEKRMYQSTDEVLNTFVFSSVDYSCVDEKIDSLRHNAILYLQHCMEDVYQKDV